MLTHNYKGQKRKKNYIPFFIFAIYEKYKNKYNKIYLSHQLLLCSWGIILTCGRKKGKYWKAKHEST